MAQESLQVDWAWHFLGRSKRNIWSATALLSTSSALPRLSNMYRRMMNSMHLCMSRSAQWSVSAHVVGQRCIVGDGRAVEPSDCAIFVMLVVELIPVIDASTLIGSETAHIVQVVV